MHLRVRFSSWAYQFSMYQVELLFSYRVFWYQHHLGVIIINLIGALSVPLLLADELAGVSFCVNVALLMNNLVCIEG